MDPIYCKDQRTKHKETESKNKLTLQEQHIMCKGIKNIVPWEKPMIVDEEGDALGIRKLRNRWFFGFSNSEEQKSVSGQETNQLVILSLEAILGTKNRNKKIQGSCYRSNIPQNSKKPKSWVASQQALFFNAF